MPHRSSPPRHYFTEASRAAGAAVKAAKRAEPDRFGVPELFIVKAGDRSFTWELRRFGGVLLQRGTETYPDVSMARVAGGAALTALCASPDLPTFKREPRSEKTSTVTAGTAP